MSTKPHGIISGLECHKLSHLEKKKVVDSIGTLNTATVKHIKPEAYMCFLSPILSADWTKCGIVGSTISSSNVVILEAVSC